MNVFNIFFDLFKFLFHNGNIAVLALFSFFMLVICPIIFFIRYHRFFKGKKSFQIKEYTLYNFIFLLLISFLSISLLCSILKLSGIIILTYFALCPQYRATPEDIYSKTFKITSNNCIVAEKSESEHYAEGIYLDYAHKEIDYVAFKKSDKGYRITGVKRINFDKISTEKELTQVPMYSKDNQATFLEMHLVDMEEKMLFYRKNPAFDELDKYIICYGTLDEETNEKWKDTYAKDFEYIKKCGYNDEYSLYKVSY